jgi:hypothetical protein
MDTRGGGHRAAERLPFGQDYAMLKAEGNVCCAIWLRTNQLFR